MCFHRAALIFCLLLVPTSAIADCFLNGKRYDDGARAGVFVCQKGRWVRSQ
jgi:hypothetical protein